MVVEQVDAVSSARAAIAVGLGRAHRLRAAILSASGLVLLLAMLATAIVLAQSQSRATVRTNFALRGTSSGTLISTYLSEQADRQRNTARQFLSDKHVSAARFSLLVSSFGGTGGSLLDDRGRLLATAPSDPALIGRQMATHYAHLRLAEHGQVAISNVVYSALRSGPVMAVAVPYPTARGRRVFSVSYRASSSTLDAFVDHAIAYRQHQVFLIDAAGRLLAASPRTGALTLSAVDPQLARVVARSAGGVVPATRVPTTFTSATVPGTPWRLLIAVPDSLLYSSIAGWTQLVPWFVFALVAAFGILLIALFVRSLADRERLASLSASMERTAHTDSLTGLLNRRALSEHLTRAAAHARRRGESLSVLMIDLDRFKQTNDSFGHEAGDQVLCTVAECMREVFRGDDIYGRWGGDEFLALLPATPTDGADEAALRLREAARAVDLGDIGLTDGVPLSVGVATGLHTSSHDIVREADLALYRAKAERQQPPSATAADGSPVSSAPARTVAGAAER